MNVMHFHFGKEGGAERFFVHLANAFAERGWGQQAVIRPGRSWRGDLDPSIAITESNFRNLSLDRFLLPRRILKRAEREKPDAMMAWAPRASEFMPDYRGGIRVSRLGDYPKKLDYFRHTDCIVCNTPGIAGHVRELGWDRGLKVISNFTSGEQVVPAERAATGGPPVVMSLGRFVKRKGFHTLIEAIAAVPDAQLWLAGEGEEEAALRALARDLDVSHRVRFLGWQADPRPFIAASDVFVMPSSHEPLGNVILEAWAQGRPVVSTRSEGPAWFMRDGENGLLAEIGDAEAMARAIGQILAEPSLAAHLADGGRKTLEAQFSKKAITDAYLELFQTPPDRFR
jgi:glycosyltransferase involved in cell wall biosynthesis